MLLTHNTGFSLIALNLSLIAALTSEAFLSRGSLTKVHPLFDPGGIIPQIANLNASIIVVLPEPFFPSIKVTGFKKSITSIHSGQYDHKPVIPNFSIVDISKFTTLNLY